MVPNGVASTSVMALFDIITGDFQQQKAQATPKNSSISRRKRLHVGFHDERQGKNFDFSLSTSRTDCSLDPAPIL